MGRLRYSVLLLAFAAVLLTVTVPIRVPNNNTFWYDLFDAGHYPLFALLSLLFFWSPLADRWKLGKRCGLAAALAAVFAVLVESLQPLIGRTASSRDLVNGLLGIAVAMIGAYFWSRSVPTALRVLHSAIAIAVLAVLLLPAAREFRALRWRSAHFPMLAGFEDPIETGLWKPMTTLTSAPTSIDRVLGRASDGRFSLRVRTRGGAWPGVRYSAGQMGWSAFKTLRFDIDNPDEPFFLNVRIDDRGDCSTFNRRFNHRFQISAGSQTVAIPLESIRLGPTERELDLDAIRWVYLFTGKHDSPRTFHIDRVRLE